LRAVSGATLLLEADYFIFYVFYPMPAVIAYATGPRTMAGLTATQVVELVDHYYLCFLLTNSSPELHALHEPPSVQFLVQLAC